MNFSAILVAMMVAVATVVVAVPLEKRDGPMLALPGESETAGNYLARLLSGLPLLGPLSPGVGLPQPKHN
ncbi:hypothetical protein COEREDRAFT_94472 [Coemansia reversa NRRL 1564]|uniref:Uncharacterized protein n=1 Tax=Coemansia reversa (strain ATCC 12441 / NRRL 1564) TaxID=763665 RepID=A0A2G5B3N4_COERN|nr:hypothetical protein COEREDRAFT_94472 [Coemansia reversa NRRL 1564]|eukprot:PIA13605.1 hypothetical protein COEREDRAFT_94472 [Coemansia reversa NRRL 1564]